MSHNEQGPNRFLSKRQMWGFGLLGATAFSATFYFLPNGETSAATNSTTVADYNRLTATSTHSPTLSTPSAIEATPSHSSRATHSSSPMATPSAIESLVPLPPATCDGSSQPRATPESDTSPNVITTLAPCTEEPLPAPYCEAGPTIGANPEGGTLPDAVVTVPAASASAMPSPAVCSPVTQGIPAQ